MGLLCGFFLLWILLGLVLVISGHLATGGGELRLSLWFAAGCVISAVGIIGFFFTVGKKRPGRANVVLIYAFPICLILFMTLWAVRFHIHAWQSRQRLQRLQQPTVQTHLEHWMKSKELVHWVGGIPGAMVQDVGDLKLRRQLGKVGIKAVKAVEDEDSSGRFRVIFLVTEGNAFYDHGYMYSPSGKVPSQGAFEGTFSRVIRLSDSWFEFWE